MCPCVFEFPCLKLVGGPPIVELGMPWIDTSLACFFHARRSSGMRPSGPTCPPSCSLSRLRPTRRFSLTTRPPTSKVRSPLVSSISHSGRYEVEGTFFVVADDSPVHTSVGAEARKMGLSAFQVNRACGLDWKAFEGGLKAYKADSSGRRSLAGFFKKAEP